MTSLVPSVGYSSYRILALEPDVAKYPKLVVKVGLEPTVPKPRIYSPLRYQFRSLYQDWEQHKESNLGFPIWSRMCYHYDYTAINNVLHQEYTLDIHHIYQYILH